MCFACKPLANHRNEMHSVCVEENVWYCVGYGEEEYERSGLTFSTKAEIALV